MDQTSFVKSIKIKKETYLEKKIVRLAFNYDLFFQRYSVQFLFLYTFHSINPISLIFDRIKTQCNFFCLPLLFYKSNFFGINNDKKFFLLSLIFFLHLIFGNTLALHDLGTVLTLNDDAIFV